MAGLILGIVIGNWVRIPKRFSDGIKLASSRFLEWSIILLAFSINMKEIASGGWQNLVVIILIVFLVLLVTMRLSKWFKCPGSTSWLIGFGTAICGSSAIAAAAPTLSKNKEDVGIALAVVNLMGTLGMLLIPLIFKFIPVSDSFAGFFSGAVLHSVGNVAGAAFGISEGAGEIALAVKLTRVALLTPAVIFFTLLVRSKNAQVESASTAAKPKTFLPLYLWAFIAITIVGSLVLIPKPLTDIMSTSGNIVLTIAMFAIGIKVSFVELYKSGQKAMGFGLVVFVVQILLALIFWSLLQTG